MSTMHRAFVRSIFDGIAGRENLQADHGISAGLLHQHLPVSFTSSSAGAVVQDPVIPRAHDVRVNIPPSPMKVFVGRDKLSESLEDWWAQEPRPCRFAFHGPGGIGSVH